MQPHQFHALHLPSEPRKFVFRTRDVERTVYTGGSDEEEQLVITLKPGR